MLWDAKKSNPRHPGERTVNGKGEMYICSKCTKFITVTFSIIRPHDLFSSFYVPKLQFMSMRKSTKKVPLELSVLIKYQLFLTVIYTH